MEQPAVSHETPRVSLGIEHEKRMARQNPLDGATPERLVKAGIAYELTGNEVQRVTEAPLDRLRHHRRITHRQFEAGDRFRRDAYTARVEPTAASVDWSSIGANFGPKTPSMFTSQAIADARQRHRRAEAALGGLFIEPMEWVLIEERAVHEYGRVRQGYANERDAMVAGLTVFRFGLLILADHYNLVDEDKRRRPSVWRSDGSVPR